MKRSPPVPRKTPRQQRATVTVDAMVTAVERVLEQHGAGGLTTNRVAQVAGVSVGTLYHYFPNKEALVSALQERVMQELLTAFRAVLGAAGTLTLSELVARIGAAFLAIFRGQRPMHRWLIDLRGHVGYQERLRGVLDVFVDELAAFLASRPEIALEDPRTVAFVLVHSIEGISAGAGGRPGRVDVETITRATVQMIVDHCERWPRAGGS